MSEPSPPETSHLDHCTVVLDTDAAFSFGMFRFNKHTYHYNFFPTTLQPLVVVFSQPGSGAIASSPKRFLDHTQTRATVGRIPLDE
jgi:hypothetical protein